VSTKFFALLLIIVPLVSCDKKNEEARLHEKTIRMPEISQEIYLPTKLWDTITGASFENAVRSSFNFAPVIVYFREKTPTVLTEKAIKFDFPNGGGEIDLAKYIRNERGTFYIKFEFDGFPPDAFSDVSGLKVHYVSKGKKRRIDGTIYGSGCDTYMDIKDYIIRTHGFDKLHLAENEGFEVNVTRDRHISALAGHFVFSYKKNNDYFVSQVTFNDSSHPELLCEIYRTGKKEGAAE
jgi:hypothetical protein